MANCMKEQLASRFQISDATWQALAQISQTRQLKKKDLLILEGEPFGYEVFVSAGTLRSFKVSESGHERTTGFFEASEFVGTSNLRMVNGRSVASYQAASRAKIILLEGRRFRQLLAEHSELLSLAQYAKDQEVARQERRESCLLEETSVAKLRHLRQQYPDLEANIPHYYIASYLGISPVTLSRSRKKLQ